MDVRPLDPRAPRALPAVTPVPRAGGASPIARELLGSGVDLGTLLGEATDSLIAREMPSATALGEVLERARGALVRGAPREVLAALDADWEGAARTDGGWYYRAAALLLLGLAGEADRVLDQAVDVRPGASAPHFLRSVVRSALGDASGARAALEAATSLHPLPTAPGEPAVHPVLRAWEAVLRARSGDPSGASALLGALPETEIAAPVLAWARQVVQRTSADAMRHGAGRAATAPAATSPAATAQAEPDAQVRLDPLEGALHRLGARLSGAPADALQADVRAALQALSPAGLLRDAAAPAREQAVRSVLGSLLQLLAERAGTPAHGVAAAVPSAAPGSPAVPPWRREVLLALREGRLEEVERELQRGAHREAAGAVTVLRALARGAGVAGELVDGSPSVLAPRDDGVLAPVRFGLVLLPDPWAVRAPEPRRVRRAPATPAGRAALADAAADRPSREARGLVVPGRLRLLLFLLLAGAAWLALR